MCVLKRGEAKKDLPRYGTYVALVTSLCGWFDR